MIHNSRNLTKVVLSKVETTILNEFNLTDIVLQNHVPLEHISSAIERETYGAAKLVLLPTLVQQMPF